MTGSRGGRDVPQHLHAALLSRGRRLGASVTRRTKRRVLVVEPEAVDVDERRLPWAIGVVLQRGDSHDWLRRGDQRVVR